MATPTLSTINSYSVNDGVTISFDANYGTNLVRGSVLTIMDMYNNILAWHIYIPDTYASASSTHVIPSKQALVNESEPPQTYDTTTPYTVDSIVSYNGSTYKCVVANTGELPDNSDKWKLLGNVVGEFSYISSDFLSDYVDEQQYQYSIQTFVSYANDLTLQGRSADSNIVSAWTLPKPSVQIATIGDDNIINTTSYTIGVTYNTNIATSIINSVFNPPKKVEFELYEYINSGWTLAQTSGVVYNGGTMINNNSYYMNYTFRGMSNGSSYRVKVNITSLLGMDATSTSNTFIVNASTYQLGAFSVNNNSCDGCITITSTMVNVGGVSDVEPQDGELDLHNGESCTWEEGLAFTNNWTMRAWVYDLAVAESVPSEDTLIHLGSSTTGGIIDIYALEDPSDSDYIKMGMYVYPVGYDSSVVTYIESNSVLLSSITQSTPLCIAFGFDYDVSGSYFIKVTV